MTIHGWFSELSAVHNSKVYIYKDIKCDLVMCTIISNTSDNPYHKSSVFYDDCMYMGVVNSFQGANEYKIIDTPIRNYKIKNIIKNLKSL